MDKRTRLSAVVAVVSTVTLVLSAMVSAQSPSPAMPTGASHWTATYTTTGFDSQEATTEDGFDVATEEATIVATDPRISGDWRQVRHLQTFHSDAGPDILVSSATARLDNAEGAWSGSFTGAYEQRDGGFAEEWNVLRGEEAYEGMTALFHWRAGGPPDMEGVIVPSDLPPTPDPIASPGS